MKSIPGLNFINVLRAAFMLADLKRAKETVKLSAFFLAVLGSAGVKAAYRTLMKSKPGGNFTNPCAQSANVLAHRVWHNQFHYQNFPQLYQCT